MLYQKFKQPLKTWRDNTHTKFGQKFGSQDKAKGWARFSEISSSEGSLWKKHYPADSDMGTASFSVWKGDFKLKMAWDANTHGERWVWPGGAKVDNIWGNVSPKGTVEVNISVIPEGATIKEYNVTVSSYPGNDDRANNFVSETIVKARLKGEIIKRLKTFGIPIKVD